MDAPAAKIESRPRRLQVILAEAGLTSRRKAEAWIAAGRVSVDGEIVRRQGLCLDAAGHDIRVDGRPLPSPPPVGVWKLHKPVGVTCTLEDRHARRTLRDLWGSEGDRLGLRPVGRLDRDSRGLLLLSNDGELTHRLTHPRYAVRRVYEATLAGPLHAGLLPILTAGVEIDGRRARPEAVEVLRHDPATTVVRIVLCEGRKREIRRLCAAAGYEVVDLLRTDYGPVSLGGLLPGMIEPLSPPLLRRLYREVAIHPPQPIPGRFDHVGL